MKDGLKGSILLFIASLIWGSAFVSQREAMVHLSPFTFNACRSIVGFISLIPVFLYFRKTSLKEHPLSKPEEDALNKRSVFAGIICGIALCVASCFQQIGISTTTAGKAGFITALYIVIVPVFGIFLKKATPWNTWISIGIAIAGFHLLCINENFSISTGDFFCLICAFCFSVQILFIDHFTKSEKPVDPIMMSLVQFFTVSVISLILTFLFETPDINSILLTWRPILYAGIFSSGVAYTLQILGQKKTPASIAPLIMSLESVFSVLFGWLILSESMTPKEIAGCALVFIAVVLSQLSIKNIFGFSKNVI